MVKNILLLSTHLNTGGITSYLWTLSKALSQRGYTVHLLSGGGHRAEAFKKAGIRLITRDIRTKSELSPKIYRTIRPLEAYVRQHAIDVIHAHTRITQVMSALLQRISGVPYITTCHGFFKRRLSRRLFPCWGKKVIAISPAVQRHLWHDFGVQKDRVVLIRNGIDLEDFSPVNEEQRRQWRQALNLKDEGPFLGMVARLSEVKGQDILVRAMAAVIRQVPTARLLLIGEGRLAPVLRALVAEQNLQKYVLFYPVQDQTSRMLSILDIFVNPSRQEGLGLAVMEAQAAGLPVVASRVGGIPDLIEHGRTGILVEPENPQRLAKALVDILSNPVQQKQMALAARQHALHHYAASMMIDKTIQVYEDVCR